MSEAFWKTTGGHWAIGGIVAYSLIAILVFVSCATGGCAQDVNPSSGRFQPDIPDWAKEDCCMRFLWILISFFIAILWGVAAAVAIFVLLLMRIRKSVAILFEGTATCCGISYCGDMEEGKKTEEGIASRSGDGDAEAGQAGIQLEGSGARPSMLPPPHAAELRTVRVNSAKTGAAPPPYSSMS